MYLQRCLVVTWLVSRETAAVWAHFVYTMQPCTMSRHFMQSHIRRLYACLAVTCYLHFWQNDRDPLCAIAVTRGWGGYRNKSQHRKLTLEKKILPPLLWGFEPPTFDHEPGALTTELSLLPKVPLLRRSCFIHCQAFSLLFLPSSPPPPPPPSPAPRSFSFTFSQPHSNIK